MRGKFCYNHIIFYREKKTLYKPHKTGEPTKWPPKIHKKSEIVSMKLNKHIKNNN